jgi:hypothetical protein
MSDDTQSDAPMNPPFRTRMLALVTLFSTIPLKFVSAALWCQEDFFLRILAGAAMGLEVVLVFFSLHYFLVIALWHILMFISKREGAFLDVVERQHPVVRRLLQRAYQDIDEQHRPPQTMQDDTRTKFERLLIHRRDNVQRPSRKRKNALCSDAGIDRKTVRGWNTDLWNAFENSAYDVSGFLAQHHLFLNEPAAKAYVLGHGPRPTHIQGMPIEHWLQRR